jgi:hypothetical protein
MSEIIPDAKEIETNYENFIAVCPECGYKNIFNRVSDLKTTQPISGKAVRCFNESCGKTFNINRDRVHPRYLTLLFDCHPSYEEKRYSNCVLLLAQALEVFFYHYLKVELVYRPSWKENRRDISLVDSLLNDLQSAVEKLAYGKLKNVFLNWVVNESKILCFADSTSKISTLTKYSNNSPSEEEIKRIPDSTLADLLIELKNCQVDKLRNKVVHKEAYRPNREEVETTRKEVHKLLMNLSCHLDVLKEDINFYH